MELIVLYAAPETIYLKNTSGGIETIQRSFSFLQDCWIEWFIPNGLIVGALWLAAPTVMQLPLYLWPVLVGATVHVVMVFRGFLFGVLDSSTHRQRMFRFGANRS
jgi:hypothetical protein